MRVLFFSGRIILHGFLDVFFLFCIFFRVFVGVFFWFFKEGPVLGGFFQVKLLCLWDNIYKVNRITLNHTLGWQYYQQGYKVKDREKKNCHGCSLWSSSS